MQKVWVDDECFACGACVDVCPEVFEIIGDLASVRPGAELNRDEELREAAEACPVAAIHCES